MLHRGRLAVDRRAGDREVFGVELNWRISLRRLASDRHLPCEVPLLAIDIQYQLIVSWYKKVDEMSNLLHKTSIPELCTARYIAIEMTN